MTTTESYCLLDIRGLLLRRYHSVGSTAAEAFQEFLSRDLDEMLEIFPPINIIACWDKGNDYRRGIYSAYKQARRDEKVDPAVAKDTKELFRLAEAFFKALGIRNVSVAGQESDDLIALFCQALIGPLTVWTIDADLLQLVQDGEKRVVVRLSDHLYTSPTQTHKDIPLHLVRLHKSLVGDSSDGYSGVPGVGPAGWASLVEFVGIDGMLELQEIIETKNRALLEEVVSSSDHKVLKKLLTGWAEWTVSYTLAKLHPEICHLVVNDKIIRPEWNVGLPNEEKLSQVLFACGASDMLPRYRRWLPTETLYDADNVAELVHLQRTLQTDPVVSFDFESYDTLKHAGFKKASHSSDFVDVLSQSVTGISVNYGQNCEKTFYLSLNHADTNNVKKDWVQWVLQILFSRERPTVVQNANFELSVSHTDLEFPYHHLGAVMDTAILSMYVDENKENHLKAMSREWFGYQQTTYKEVVGDRDMSELPAVEVLSYGCDDSFVTSHLFLLFRLIMQIEGTWDFYERYETRHAVDAVRTFVDGCPIDLPLLERMSAEDRATIAEADSRIRGVLEEKCADRPTEEVTEAAKTLLEMWWELPSLSYRGVGEDPPSQEVQERAAEKYASLWSRAWEACWYIPLETTTTSPEFSLTPGKFNEITALLGHPELCFEKSLSGNQISSWFDQAEDLKLEPGGEFRAFLDALQMLAIAASGLQKRASKGGFGSLEKDEVVELPEYANFLQVVQDIYRTHKVGKVEQVGDELNYGSSKQMQALLYGKLALPVRRRGKVLRGTSRDLHGLQGGPVTGNKAIAAAIVYDVPESDWRRPVLMDYRQIVACRQNISLFYDPYPLWTHPRDGNIHPQVKNCGTVTRRPSGSSPNILQVSKKDAAKIRKLYLPWKSEEQYIHISLDFVGQEVVITACESRDPVMLDALARGRDVHSMTSTGFAHIMLERVGGGGARLSYEQFKELKETQSSLYKVIRNSAKAVLFLTFYGGGAGTLAENLLIEQELAQSMIDGLFRTYSRLEPWQQEVISYARKNGYVKTAYGNRYHLSEELFSEETGFRSRQERQAVNAVIQSTAADVLKVTLTEIHRRQMLDRFRIKGLKPVYDEISAMVPLSLAAEYIAEMREVMAITPPGYPLTLSTDVSVGLRWGDVEEITDFSQQAINGVIERQLGEMA